MLGSRTKTVLHRLWQALPVLFGVVVVTFLLTRALPGDPAVYFAGPAADEKSIAEIRKSLGLDLPLPQQFLIYLNDLARGDLGQSLSTGQPVLADLTTRLPASLELTFADAELFRGQLIMVQWHPDGALDIDLCD